MWEMSWENECSSTRRLNGRNEEKKGNKSQFMTIQGLPELHELYEQ